MKRKEKSEKKRKEKRKREGREGGRGKEVHWDPPPQKTSTHKPWFQIKLGNVFSCTPKVPKENFKFITCSTNKLLLLIILFIDIYSVIFAVSAPDTELQTSQVVNIVAV